MITRLFNTLLKLIKNAKNFYLRCRIRGRLLSNKMRHTSSSEKANIQQNLSVYHEQNFLHSVNTWGEGTVWTEIQYLLVNSQGKVLDIACGTCVIHPKLMRTMGNRIDLYGCDISEYLIENAIQTAMIPKERLRVCDFCKKTPYPDNFFDHSYSIGSLEHFTEDGINCFINECHRITRKSSFHFMPTSRSKKNEGWLELDQSYFNNTVEWWVNKFKKAYKKIYVLDSSWEDPISVGKWFICVKE